MSSLRELETRRPSMIFVDCFALLAKFQKSKILQHDGFHLSLFGHSVVGEAVGQSIIQDLRK